MTDLLPLPFLFRYAIPIRRLTHWPAQGSHRLPDDHRLPQLHERFATDSAIEWFAGWNDEGLAIGLSVRRSTTANVPVNERGPVTGDHFQLWFDTRHSATVHRASRYCAHFVVSAEQALRDTGRSTAVASHLILRAKDEHTKADVTDCRAFAGVHKQGYDVAVWLDRRALYGYEPSAHPQVGFFARMVDKRQGAHNFYASDLLPVESDPSMWCTLDLR